MRLYGHRGARGERAENTLAGFAHAVGLGVAGIETDIAMTADLVPVLHHDAALADGQLICLLRRDELPPEIPTLAQALAEIPAGEWLLEIKTYPLAPETSHKPADVVAATLPLLTEALRPRVRIFAFEWAVLRACAAAAPDLKRVCLTAPDTVAARAAWWGPGFAEMSTPQAVAASGAFGWAAHAASLTEEAIDEARDLGLEVFTWTVNEPEEYARLAPLVDGLITDLPSRFVAQSRDSRNETTL